jgi:hypothetical protein
MAVIFSIVTVVPCVSATAGGVAALHYAANITDFVTGEGNHRLNPRQLISKTLTESIHIFFGNGIRLITVGQVGLQCADSILGGYQKSLTGSR